jgi:hypothetical protein
VLSLANQIRNNPMFFSNLEVISSQANEFGAPESASDQQRQDGTVTLASRRIEGRRLQQRSGLIEGQPIANPDSQSLRAFDPADSCGQFWAQKPGVRRFVSQSPNRCQAHVDSGGSEVVLFKEEPIPEDNCSVERQSGLRAVPTNEFIDCVTVG